ncbi:MAG: GerAB/ArcD/ProY family transporter [Oscillospiraceae bacterium]|nr:GerAB/ArcD/ProY family transporter [Oscillospiraceae bacterium]
MKISSAGAISLLLVSRIFTLMIYTSDKGFTSVSFLLGICLSTVIQGILSLVLIFLVKKSSADDFYSLISKNRFLMIILSLFYGAFFILSGSTVLKNFTSFANELFFENVSPFLIAIPIVLVAVYGAFTGIKSVSRSASVIFCIFVFMFLSTAISSTGKISPAVFDETSLSLSSVAKYTIYDISASPEFVMLPFFCLYSKNIRKDYFSFLSLRLIILTASSFLMASVLKDFVNYTDFPFFTLAGAVGNFIKSDALYLVIWTLSASVKLSLILHFVNIFTEKIPLKKHLKFILSGVIITLISLTGIVTENNGNLQTISAVFILLMGGIIPIIFFSKEVFSLDKKTYYDNNNNLSSDRM